MLRDVTGEIRYEKIVRWSLPRFDDTGGTTLSLFEWQAARMRNYMVKIKKDPEIMFKAKYFNGDKVIHADHVARMSGAALGNMLCGGRSNKQAFSTREWLNAIAPIQASMTLDAMEDFSRFLHFADDWDDEEWESDYNDVKVEPSDNTAQHRKKFSMIEDAYNRRWQSLVKVGKWLTADESRVAGWYYSMITMGPEPKPIRTGATLHSLCITHGSLATYKVFARTYGGKHDADMNQRHPNNDTLLKTVSLYSIMLEGYKGKGHHLVMDSAYMSDQMAQVGREVWKVNMVGTVQSNRTGGGKLGKASLKAKEILKGSADSLLYQHSTLPLAYAIWADNNFVKTLSNFHTPCIVEDGVKRKRKNKQGRRDQYQTSVPIPSQTKDYCETYHLIDKGNGREAKFCIGGGSKKHGWSPKLAARLFNMNLNNAY